LKINFLKYYVVYFDYDITNLSILHLLYKNFLKFIKNI